MKNCPNCGSAIEPYKYKCEYCGTYYFDLASMFDMDDNKPCYIKFKMKDFYLTALALPTLEEIETHMDTCADISVRFRCLENHETKSLFQVQIADKR